MAKLLILDDQAANRDFLPTLLGYCGHQLLEASDGTEALERAKTEHPDLIIADLLMANMDGFEFVRPLRTEPDIAGTKVIFYTATHHEQKARPLASQCGVCHLAGQAFGATDRFRNSEPVYLAGFCRKIRDPEGVQQDSPGRKPWVQDHAWEKP